MLSFLLKAKSIINALLVAGDVWAFVSWIWGNEWELLDSFSAPEYSALIAFFTILLIIINYAFFDELKWKLPSYRFKSLVGDIGTHRSNSESMVEKPPFLMVERMKLVNHLKKLKLESPGLHENNDTWVYYLVLLEPLAEHKNLKDARILLDKLKN